MTADRLRAAGLRSKLAGPFDLTLARGACLSVTGPSGAGKSLLLRMLADLDPSEGEFWLDGQARHDIPAPQWRRRVVYCPAESGWWDEHVAAHFPGPTLAAARALAQHVGLADGLLDGPVLRLSTGERQRLALIRALVLDPPVLLLDEPTGALDQDSTALVEAVLRDRLTAGTAIVMVTHSAEQANRLAQQHFRMAARPLAPA
ncbi:MAG: ATP-binding cassette domain-containing protein [Acetobacteraceae bacterium]|nr:ATP-binding cassette domain-containing protein [Acetobacteraceae bacterium]